MNTYKNKLFAVALIISAMAFGTQSCSDKEGEVYTEIVGGLSLSADKAILLLNGTVKLEAKVFPEEAPDKSVVWKSDNPSVASVDNNGLVNTLSEGTANITVTSVGNEGLVRTCVVTVLSSLEVNLSATSLFILKGTTGTLKAEILPSSISQDVTWSSDNPGVASVDGNGTITAVSFGTAKITVTSALDPSQTAECSVAVVAEASRAGWTAESRGGNHPWGEYGGEPYRLFDGDFNTGWHTNVSSPLPQCLVIDMQESLSVAGVQMEHLTGGLANNWIYFNHIEIYLTETAVTPGVYQSSWGEPAAKYTWPGGIDPFSITLSALTKGRYMILYFPDSRTNTYISFAELTVYTIE
jgi:hypothetical protein